MKLICLILAAGAAYAQSTRYPGAVDSDNSLFVVGDNVQTSLNAAMGTGDTAAVVANAAGFAVNMIATICDTSTSTGKCTAWEHMLVTAVTGNVLTVTRGFAGTVARTHSAGKLVSILINSVHQKVLKDSIVAIETALGPNLVNIGISLAVNASTYNFSPYSCNSASVCAPGGPSGMGLIAGNNTLTMTPVPNGVNGSDTDHRVYVSGGTGAAEACLITGGAGTANQPSGAIILNCGNAHSGAWTIQSATGGIQEAIQPVKAAGGNVSIASGTTTLRAAIQLPSNVTLTGTNQGATVLQVANGALGSNLSWQVPGVASLYCVICLAANSSFERIRDLTIDANGTNQTWLYYGDITGNNVSNLIIEGVTVKNHPNNGGTGVQFQLLGHTPLSANANNVILNSSAIGTPGCAVPNGGGAYYIEGAGNRVISSYATNYCDSPFVLAACDHCGIYNSVANLGNANMSTATFSIEGATNSVLSGNHCIATGTNPNRACFAVESSSGGLGQSAGNVLIGNSASHCQEAAWVGTNLGTNTQIVTDTVIEGLHADGCSGNGVLAQQYVNKLSIVNSTFTAIGGAGVFISSTGTNVVTNISIRGNTFDHTGTPAAIYATNNSTGSPVNGLTVANNFLGDTYASPTSVRGILITAGLVNNAYIAGNVLAGNTSGAFVFQNTWDAFSVVTNNPGGGSLYLSAATLGSASAAGGGSQRYCGDCTTAAICVTGGTGHMATSNGTAWTCN